MSELRQRGGQTTTRAATDKARVTASTAAVARDDSPVTAAVTKSSAVPFVLACLLLLLPVRIISALYMPILDCDETFNYWEPLHFLLFGRGLQTWEYSPVFGLRSYAYLWLISPAAWVLKAVHQLRAAQTGDADGQEVDKRLLFYAVRISFAVAVAVIETRLLRTVRRVLGSCIARWMLLFLALSAGMSHAAPAFLPQTFTMMFVMLTLDAWLNRNYRCAIFFTGVASLVGWPFSVLLSVPLAIEVLYEYAWRGRGLLKPVWWSVCSAALCVLPCLVVDFAYFRRVVFAVVNIAVYNSNSTSEHGANLYGKEPASFYFVNLALNFNIAAPLAMGAPILLLLARAIRGGSGGRSGASVSELGVMRWVLPFHLWLGIFLSMPHKEERFLFVVYPYLALSAAVSTFIVTRALQGCFTPFALANFPVYNRGGACARTLSNLCNLALVVGFVTLSLSRCISLVVNYRAPIDVWTAMQQRAVGSLTDASLLPFPLASEPDASASAAAEVVRASSGAIEPVNVCVGKEWYRFPTHFFLPSLRIPAGTTAAEGAGIHRSSPRQLDFTLRFLDSDFGGLLPKAYLQQHELTASADESLPVLPARIAKLVPVSLLRDTFAWLERSFPHLLLARPGSWVPPSHMNDFNRREDGGRFVPPDHCPFIVDFALPAAAQREPLYEQHKVMLPQPLHLGGRCVAGWQWRVVFAAPFLDAASSPSALLRAFWIPKLSAENNVMRPYQLLQREPIACTAEQQA